MELLLGSHVREHGNRVGRLAGLEFEPATRKIRRILVSADGDLGPHATGHSIAAVTHVHDDGEIELRTDIDTGALPAVGDVIVLSRATRLRRSGHDAGRLNGIELNPAEREIVSVLGRQHWWSRRLTFGAAGMDCSTPGQIRVGAAGGSRAA